LVALEAEYSDDDDDDDEWIYRARHNSPQTRYRSAKQVVLQMSGERLTGELLKIDL